MDIPVNYSRLTNSQLHKDAKLEIYELASLLLTENNLTRILEILSNFTVKQYQAKYAFVVVNRQQELSDIFCFIGDFKIRCECRLCPFTAKNSLFGNAFESKSIKAIYNYWEDTSFEHTEDNDQLMKEIGCKSLMVVPLLADNQVIALLTIFKVEIYEWQEVDLLCAIELSNIGGAAIKTARSLKQIQFLSDSKSVLLELCRNTLFMLDINQMLNLLTERAKELLEVDSVTIGLIENNMLIGDNQSPGFTFNYAPVLPSYLSGKGVGGRAYTTGEVAYTNDYFNDQSFEHSPDIDNMIRIYF